MSTRSSIAIKRPNGTVESIYCHSDGYLEYNGVMLNNFYREMRKINSLINLGDISFLDRRVNPDPDLPHKFDYDKRQEGITVAYGRDRDEKNCSKKNHKSVEDYIKSFENSWQEFAYLYDEENGKWLWSEIPYENVEEMKFDLLEPKLDELNLLEKIDEKKEQVIKKQIEYEKFFDIENYNNVYESDEDARYDFSGVLETCGGVMRSVEALRGYLYEMNEGDNEYFQSMSEEHFNKLKTMTRSMIRTLNKYGRETFEDYHRMTMADIDM